MKRSMTVTDLEMGSNPTKRQKCEKSKSLNDTSMAEDTKSESDHEMEQNHYSKPETSDLKPFEDDSHLDDAKDPELDDEDYITQEISDEAGRCRDSKEQFFEALRIALINSIDEGFIEKSNDVNAYALTCEAMYQCAPTFWVRWLKHQSIEYRNQIKYNIVGKPINMKNYGNTCFISVVMHVIHYINKVCPSFQIVNERIQKIMHYLDGSNSEEAQTATYNFIKTDLRGRRTPDNFGNGQQKDADEFFSWLIQYLQPEHMRLRTAIPGIGGLESMNKTCTVVIGHVSSTPPIPFFQLHMAIKGRGLPSNNPNIQTIIKAHFQFEKQGHTPWCKHCKNTAGIIFSPRINALPEILVITLKRYNAAGIKIDKRIELREEITVPVWDDVRSKEKQIEMQLVGWINHSGITAITGHYNCYFISSINENGESVFKKFDDVTQDDETLTLAEVNASKESSSFTPYILIFQRTKLAISKPHRINEYKSKGPSEDETKSLKKRGASIIGVKPLKRNHYMKKQMILQQQI